MAAHRDKATVALLLDCDYCKRVTRTEQRQMWGCAYEPPLVNIRPRGWRHNGNEDAPEPTHCPGYTTKLPEVSARTWQLHWLKVGGYGMLVAKLGREPTERDIFELELIDAASATAESWSVKNPPERPS